MAYLTEAGELCDKNGMASPQLAAAVGYPGSSVAFAQLLSGMERSGLIEREVRGKRTYRISLGPARPAASAPHRTTAAQAAAEGPGPGDFDYDELARRLLVQVARRISDQEEPGAAWARRPDTSDEERLTEENIRLREQLRAAQRSLALAAERVRRLPITSGLAGSEIVLLQRLLAPWVRAGGEDLEVRA